jgi:hypothetical protein
MAPYSTGGGGRGWAGVLRSATDCSSQVYARRPIIYAAWILLPIFWAGPLAASDTSTVAFYLGGPDYSIESH